MARNNETKKENILAIVLMAGKGTRVKSAKPKILHELVGKPMGWFVLRALNQAGIKNRIVITGHEAEKIEAVFEGEKFVRQIPQLGTGHAVMIAKKQIPSNITHVIVLNGDTPLLTCDAVKSVVKLMKKPGCKAVVSCDWTPCPMELGRVVIDDDGNFVAIREAVDLKESEKDINWVNVGFYAFEKSSLFKYLDKLTPSKKKKEYYLTDIPGMLVKDGFSVETYFADDDSFLVMPNNRVEIADAASILQSRILQELMLNGVTITDPSRTYIEHDVKIAQDTVIHPDTYISGKTIIGSDCEIGPGVWIEESKIGNEVRIIMSSVEKSSIGDKCKIGPYSHIRPETILKNGVKVGNFCEIKKSTIDEGTKVNHLSYIGDAIIGKRVNIGAGTITCNYDGKNKHKTTIGDDAFIGSDSILVAPVSIGSKTLTGAGSVITRDIEDGMVAMGVPARVVRKK